MKITQIIIGFIIGAALVGGLVYFFDQKKIDQLEMRINNLEANLEVESRPLQCSDTNPCFGDWICVSGKCEAVPFEE